MLHEQKQEIEDKYAVVLRRHQERMGLKAEFIGDEAQVQKLEETAVKLKEELHIKTMAHVRSTRAPKKFGTTQTHVVVARCKPIIQAPSCAAGR